MRHTATGLKIRYRENVITNIDTASVTMRNAAAKNSTCVKYNCKHKRERERELKVISRGADSL